MPLAKSAPDIKVSGISTTATANPPDSFSRLDIGGVPLDIFSAFGVPLDSDEKVVGKLKLISDWAKTEIGDGTMGDALLKIRDLETHLGSPSGLNKRYQKVWEYCKMDMYSKELEKKKEALRRRF
jgi:hypothetical protein